MRSYRFDAAESVSRAVACRLLSASSSSGWRKGDADVCGHVLLMTAVTLWPERSQQTVSHAADGTGAGVWTMRLMRLLSHLQGHLDTSSWLEARSHGGLVGISTLVGTLS